MANFYNRRNNNNANGNKGNSNNKTQYLTTKSDLQFYNSYMNDEIDCSTLSFSFWKNNLLVSINPMYTEQERKSLDNGDNRVFNYDAAATMTIGLDGKSAYKLYKGILSLEHLIKKGSKAKSVAVITNSKVIKIGDGSEYGQENWYLGIYNKDSADGLLYFFNKDLESDEVVFNYNEETLKGQVKTINVELEIFKELLKEVPLMLSKGNAHEVRQEMARLKTFIDGKLENSPSVSQSKRTSGGGIPSRSRRSSGAMQRSTDDSFDDVVNESSSNDLDFTVDFDVEAPETAEVVNEVQNIQLNDISDLEDDFSIDED